MRPKPKEKAMTVRMPVDHKARTRALRREAAWARLKLDPKFADP
jgi:hypothetical protein